MLNIVDRIYETKLLQKHHPNDSANTSDGSFSIFPTLKDYDQGLSEDVHKISLGVESEHKIGKAKYRSSTVHPSKNSDHLAVKRGHERFATLQPGFRIISDLTNSTPSEEIVL